MPVPPRKKRHRPASDFLQEHPYIIKLDIKMSKLNQQLLAIYDLADCDLILSDARTGLNDFHLNETFAKKLEDISKKLASLSKQVSDKAEAIRQKIDKAVENKAQLQDCVYVGEVLEYSKLCDVIKEWDKRPQRFKASSEFRIKRELLDSSDDDDKQDEVAKKKKNSEGNGFSGDPDGHFQYIKQNENDAAAHTFICDLCQNVFRDTNELRNHEAMHSMEFYRCMQCLKVFRSVRAFDNHCASHMASHTCQTCGKVFQLKTSLTNHMQIHSDHKMKCSVPGCKKTFRWRQNQLEHIQWPIEIHKTFLAHIVQNFSRRLPVCGLTELTSMVSYQILHPDILSEILTE